MMVEGGGGGGDGGDDVCYSSTVYLILTTHTHTEAQAVHKREGQKRRGGVKF